MDTEIERARAPSIVIVDDAPENLKVLTGMLQGQGYEVRPVTSGESAIRAIRNKPPELILLDINMPDMNGYEVCETLKSDPLLRDIPIIFISALTETMDKVRAFSVGGVDYITKPFQMEEVNARVKTHLKLQLLLTNLEAVVSSQISEITESQTATILAMARLAQSRDDNTGTHLERVQGYCRLLAQGLRNMPRYLSIIDERFINLIYEASALHDIGKVGIPDHILLKPGKLAQEEFEIMKGHTVIGASTLEAVLFSYPQNEFVEMGIQVARWHHEKWDGTGYPDGLFGEAIPIPARIMALADVYDALKSERCYKRAFDHEECCRIIVEESGRLFDPEIVAVFNTVSGDLFNLWEGFSKDSEGK